MFNNINKKKKNIKKLNKLGNYNREKILGSNKKQMILLTMQVVSNSALQEDHSHAYLILTREG